MLRSQNMGEKETFVNAKSVWPETYCYKGIGFVPNVHHFHPFFFLVGPRVVLGSLSQFSMQIDSTWCVPLFLCFSATSLLTCSQSEQPVCVTALQKKKREGGKCIQGTLSSENETRPSKQFCGTESFQLNAAPWPAQPGLATVAP